jgi:hypothetical protein
VAAAAAAAAAVVVVVVMVVVSVRTMSCWYGERWREGERRDG